MFGLGVPELLVILAIVIFFYGGKRISQLGGDLGKSISGFKKAVRDYPASSAGPHKEQEERASKAVEPPALSLSLERPTTAGIEKES